MKTFCVVIPVYNNAGTFPEIVLRTKEVTSQILVVDDGSTDMDIPAFCRSVNVECVRHTVNRGKGAALRTAIETLKNRGFDYMITIDADAQHYPEDIPDLLPLLEEEGALVIGCRDFNDPNVPDASRFGRRFSNFWIKLETGKDVEDSQSGFRAYPLRYVAQLRCVFSRYNFETEILTRALWANLPLVNHGVRSYYPPKGERVSHFHPFRDNFRITLTHIHLIFLKLLPFPKRKLIAKKKFDFSIFRPKKFVRYLLEENATPEGLAAAAFTGTVLAVLPLVGFHSVAILYAAAKLHLNKLMAFNIQHLFMPPFTPALCMEAGYFLMHGRFLTEFNLQTLWHQMEQRFLEWLLGSLLLAPVFALLTAAAVYGLALFLRSFRKA